MSPTTAAPPRPVDKVETHFEEAGSLKPPKLIGRTVRLLLGVVHLAPAYPVIVGLLYPLLVLGRGWTASSPPPWWFWGFVAYAFYWTPASINIGFRKNWRRSPQRVVAGAAVLLLAVDLVVYGGWWAGPLAVFVSLWLTYFALHLGVSFVLASMLATPGCEMRAIPQLWTLVTGSATTEHYCPGFLDGLDKWEDRVRS